MDVYLYFEETKNLKPLEEMNIDKLKEIINIFIKENPMSIHPSLYKRINKCKNVSLILHLLDNRDTHIEKYNKISVPKINTFRKWYYTIYKG